MTPLSYFSIDALCHCVFEGVADLSGCALDLRKITTMTEEIAETSHLIFRLSFSPFLSPTMDKRHNPS